MQKGSAKMDGRESRSKNKSPRAVSHDEPEHETIGEDKDLDGFSSAMQLANSTALPMALQAAVELGVFDLLADAGEPGLSRAQIGARLGVRNQDSLTKLHRLIIFLSCHDLFHVSDGLYALNHVSKFFARNKDGVSLAPLLRLNNDKVLLQSWSGVKPAILEGGIPFEKAHGMNMFDYMRCDGRLSQLYNTAMFNQTTIMMKKIFESGKGFENIKILVDVGGGTGILLSLITSQNPSIKGINFDLPHVIQHAPPLPGVQHVAGNMFESVPKGDVILLKGILRDWSDEQCVKLLKNCYKALPDNGRVIVLELMMPLFCDSLSSMPVKLSNDVLTMTSNAGLERNQSELTNLAEQAGFAEALIQVAPYHPCIVEYHKLIKCHWFT